jgi:AcrR family transcriptional regulator
VDDARERVIAASLELARARRGFDASVDEIAARARMSKRTVYRHFRSKEEIVGACLDRFMAQVEAESEAILAAGGDAGQVVAAFLEYLGVTGGTFTSPRGLRALQAYPRLWERIEEFRRRRLQRLVEAVLQSAPPHAVPEVSPIVVSTVLLAAVQAVLNPDFLLRHRLDFPRAVGQLSRLLLHGLLPGARAEPGPEAGAGGRGGQGAAMERARE